MQNKITCVKSFEVIGNEEVVNHVDHKRKVERLQALKNGTTSTKQMKLPRASKILAIKFLIPMKMLGMFPPPLFFFTI
jgi:hypothetical protein